MILSVITRGVSRNDFEQRKNRKKKKRNKKRESHDQDVPAYLRVRYSTQGSEAYDIGIDQDMNRSHDERKLVHGMIALELPKMVAVPEIRKNLLFPVHRVP